MSLRIILILSQIMLKTILKYLFEVAVILSLGQIPVGKTTVGGEFVSRVSDFAQYAWKAIAKKSKNISIKDMASTEKEPNVDTKDLNALLEAEDLSESDREEIKSLLSRDE